MVSDAFFPFRDGVDVGLREGVTAVVQPGGSERDFEVIEACNEAGRGHGLHRPAQLPALSRPGEGSMQNIPVLHVEGRSLAEAYERALVALHRHGVPMATQYDRPGDPLSLDATMNITVLEPGADPMIHKAFPGGIEDLREYVLELAGAKDHWVKNMNDPEDTRWEYTYHGRLAAWGAWRELRDGRSVRGRGLPGGPGRAGGGQAGGPAAHPPGADDHLDAEPGLRLLRPALPADALVPHHVRPGRAWAG